MKRILMLRLCYKLSNILQDHCPWESNYETYLNQVVDLYYFNQISADDQLCPLMEESTISVKDTVGGEGKFFLKLIDSLRLLPVKLWVAHFLPYCCHTAHGVLIKPRNNPWVMFDISTKGDPHEVVISKITNIEFEANITFGLAELKLLQQIYNWKVSRPNSKIYTALADVTACF